MFYAPAIRSNALLPESPLLDLGFERFMNDVVGDFGRTGYELQEDEQSWTLSMDVPGIPKENLSVQVEGQSVRVETTGEARRKYKASFQLPAEIDVESSSAGLEHGVLTLKLAKLKSATARQIAVQ